MSKYGVLLVNGLRTHQEAHAPLFAAHPLCRLVAVANERDIPESQAQLNRELAAEHGIPFIPDLDEALARDDVHIVSMCAAMERRPAVAVKCAEAGKHLYLDKPLCGSLEGADAMVETVERTGVVAQMYSQILAPWAQGAKEVVESGRIGEIKAVHAEELFSKGRAGTVPEGTVRREKEQAGRFTFVESKREMSDIGVYVVGLVHWLTGKKTESVFCITGNYFFAEHFKNDVEDFGAIIMTLEGGVTASIVGGRCGWMSHPSGGTQRIVLIGTEGMAVCDVNSPRVEVYNTEPNFVAPSVDSLDPMDMWGSTQRRHAVAPKQRWVPMGGDRRRSQYDDVVAFIDCIESGREPDMNVREAAALVDVILGGYVSAARGEPVRLPLPRS